ncbi:TRK1 (YJL129C) and TRK2 (YKR050W) [Zygosaccharomyces parabailii]|nr:TRK1 (YJL129C) and TRK2 (YKR050W) [Zygosaccharomyces parabailii]
MISRTISRNPTLATFSQRYRDSFGKKLRDAIARFGHYVKPMRKYVFRNFLIVHYTYIITMTIVASIILYPIRNEKYIDILFLAAGTTTQGGLNTVNINSLKLYQQIVIYVTTFLTTPIIIHSTLAFVRLYWFERHFDGIRDSSKRNYKMRRTKTILGRELTARTMSRNWQRSGTRQFTSASRRNNDDFQEKLFSGKMLHRDEQDSLPDSQNDRGRASKSSQGLGPDDIQRSASTKLQDDQNLHSGRGLSFKEAKPIRDNHHHQPYERFARRRSREISPEDMYRSITMMQGHHQPNADDEGPALVIGAPGERSSGKSGVTSTKSEPEENKVDSPENTNERRPTHWANKNVSDGGESLTHDVNNQKGNPINGSFDINSNHSELMSDAEQQSNPFAASSVDSYSTFSGNSGVSSGSLTSDDRRTIGAADTSSSVRPLARFETPRQGINGPSIHFDISAPPSKRPDRNRVRKNRSNGSRSGFSMPKSKTLGQKLKRRLSFVDKPRMRSRNSFPDRSFEDPGRNNMENMDDYFADDESDKEDDHHSRVERQTHFPRSNTFDQRFSHSQDYLDVLGKSKSYDLGQTQDWNKLSSSPEFQKMVYKDWKRRHKGRKSLLKHRRRMETLNSRTGFKKFYSDPESDYGDSNSQYSPKGHAGSPENNEGEEHFGDTSMESRNSLDEEAGYFGPNDLGFVDSGPGGLSRSYSANYLSWEPTIGRNSTFVGMTKEQKEELGGVEYRAIKLLCRILVAYYGGFWIIAFLFLVPWMVTRHEYKKIIETDGVSPAWWGFFTGMSAFADLGLTLTPDSMQSFQKTSYPTIIMMWFIVIGNTGFPVLLRFVIWLMFQVAPDLSLTRESLGFLLDHPRRCFTMLFPSAATWWLVLTLVGMNAIDLVLFIILDFGSSTVHYLTHGYRVLVGLFQAISTRTAGFQIVDIGDLHPAVQVSYMLMMYVSVMPLAISIRRTNVYEEQSLGIYADPNEEEEEEAQQMVSSDEGNESESSTSTQAGNKKKKKKKRSNTSFIGAHLMRQLSYDLWFMFLGLFIICIVEGGKIRDNARPDFTIFAILFEIVSAYGTVGLSLGYPNSETSFSAQFNTLSKLVIIALLIRGRHRGLPYKLDRAIILPSNRLDNIDKQQEVTLRNRLARGTKPGDPVTAYFKSKTAAIKRGLLKIGKTAAEPEEHLLQEFNDHHTSGEDSENQETHEEHRAHGADEAHGANEAHEVHEIQEAQDSKGDSSPQESSSQPQEEAKAYVAQENASSSGTTASKRQSSDPYSTVPDQGGKSAHSVPSLRTYRLRRTNST